LLYNRIQIEMFSYILLYDFISSCLYIFLYSFWLILSNKPKYIYLQRSFIFWILVFVLTQLYNLKNYSSTFCNNIRSTYNIKFFLFQSKYIYILNKICFQIFLSIESVVNFWSFFFKHIFEFTNCNISTSLSSFTCFFCNWIIFYFDNPCNSPSFT